MYASIGIMRPKAKQTLTEGGSSASASNCRRRSKVAEQASIGSGRCPNREQKKARQSDRSQERFGLAVASLKQQGPQAGSGRYMLAIVSATGKLETTTARAKQLVQFFEAWARLRG